MPIDVFINVLFKPLQTALALLSLLRHSGERLGRVFFIEEPPNHPGQHDALLALLHRRLGERLVHYRPAHYLSWHTPADPARLADEAYRLSIRYQYGWERSTADLALIIHNDIEVFGDIASALAANLGDHLAIGQIGGCLFCPAHWAGKCTPDTYLSFRPSRAYLLRLYERMPEGRNLHPYNRSLPEEFTPHPWPLPHCRVNEWCLLVNLREARPLTAPLGPAMPLGAMARCGDEIMDTGVRWFRDISLLGRTCRNYPVQDHLTHHPGGHKAMNDFAAYEAGEARAAATLARDYPGEFAVEG